MNKDNLVIIGGMPRAGTTYFYKTLGIHPGIYLPVIKELDYFHSKFNREESWYTAHFADASEEQKFFDISPYYFLNLNSLQRIKNFNENQKMIFILRNPVSWKDSMYAFYLRNRLSVVTKSRDEFFAGYTIEDDSGKPEKCDLNNFDFVGRVNNIIELFAGNLMLVDFDYFTSDPLQVLKAMEAFIGVRGYFNDSNIIKDAINASSASNNRLITYLSNFSGVRSVASKMLPNKLLNLVRDRYIYGTVQLAPTESSATGNIFRQHFFNQSPIAYP